MAVPHSAHFRPYWSVRRETSNLSLSLPAGAAVGGCLALRICRHAFGFTESGRLNGLSAKNSTARVHQRQRAHW